MTTKAFQDFYSEQTAHCYGCGRLNPLGHQLKSYWAEDGETSIARFTPQPEHTAIPGFVYGGLLASLIDCHGTGTAAAAAYKHAGREMGTPPEFRYVTGALNVSYRRPTPLGPELILRGTVREIKPRKVVVDIELIAEGNVCVLGEVIAVQMPEKMVK
jgi:acyl-coenzyme A thioesterase PaaI-like protein